jgi:pimeloyl-ACP methyl ester carboxylesterase
MAFQFQDSDGTCLTETFPSTLKQSTDIYIYISLGGFTTLFTATEVPELVRGVVLLNSAGQFGDPNKPAAAPAEEEEGSPLSRFIVKPLKEAFQRVVLGFLFWQSKQPARVEKVLKSVTITQLDI